MRHGERWIAAADPEASDWQTRSEVSAAGGRRQWQFVSLPPFAIYD